MQKQQQPEMSLKLLFARQILNILPDIIHEKCYGCSVNHPSQKHHNVCMMMTNEEKIEYCLDSALERIDKKEMLQKFKDSLTIDVCESEEWKEGLKSILLSIF